MEVQPETSYHATMKTAEPFDRAAYMRKYQVAWIAKRRKSWFAANGPCVLCGSSRELQADHIDPAQKVSHRVWSWKLARREAELAKCQVLCGKCHRKKTGGENRRVPDHGVRSRYVSHGCRCDLCREAAAEYMRRWRAK